MSSKNNKMKINVKILFHFLVIKCVYVGIFRYLLKYEKDLYKNDPYGGRTFQV